MFFSMSARNILADFKDNHRVRKIGGDVDISLACSIV